MVLIDPTRPRSWWTKRTPAVAAAWPVTGGQRQPFTHAELPGSGWWYPARTLISVDLPEPFWPTSACTSPTPISRSTSINAA